MLNWVNSWSVVYNPVLEAVYLWMHRARSICALYGSFFTFDFTKTPYSSHIVDRKQASNSHPPETTLHQHQIRWVVSQWVQVPLDAKLGHASWTKTRCNCSWMLDLFCGRMKTVLSNEKCAVLRTVKIRPGSRESIHQESLHHDECTDQHTVCVWRAGYPSANCS